MKGNDGAAANFNATQRHQIKCIPLQNHYLFCHVHVLQL